MMEKFKEGPLGPTVVLTVICLVIAFALAQVYQVTAPIIEQVNRERADKARTQVLASGGLDGFAEVEGIALPDGVTEAYAANNGTGIVFKTAAKGFDGDVTFMVGMDWDGNVVGIKLFDHSETPGLGTKVGKAEYLMQYYGGVSPNAVDGVTGATKTSNALKNALAQAQEAYEMVKEAGE